MSARMFWSAKLLLKVQFDPLDANIHHIMRGGNRGKFFSRHTTGCFTPPFALPPFRPIYLVVSTPPWPHPKRARTPPAPPSRPLVSPGRRSVALFAERSCLAASTWGRGTPTPSRHLEPPSPSGTTFCQSPIASKAADRARQQSSYISLASVLES